ncbi:LacI family DNA-binding transcriptional regulator [Agromyces sp. CFH 90414]|uniref:LacI family DNA-binding transcriptional regulator n=1 Tax=Agromyces agglutinans TaxID=2662258 RepID=A0A6I2F6R9_9MICO|nr:LacI family DNA-binding transcriptional regulator [Agromyces agglutinans]MRG59944.1 LacI family DNA-binding transcriptional regulator [Agromyces agglutinans]
MTSHDTNHRRRVTAGDVAARAGVSISTVSKALSGKGAVRYETRQRILAAAEELGFQTNQVAASLFTGKTNTIGVITSDRFGRLTVPVLLGAIETLAEHEIALVLCDGRGDPIREQYFVDSFLRRRVDGILVTGAGEFARDGLRADLPVPVVYAMAWSRNERDTSVVPDDAEGARMATRHLLSTGREKLVYIAGPQRDDASRVRLTATREVLAERGLDLVHEPLFGEWTERWGRQAIKQVLLSGVDFDGVVCASDQVARGVTEALREADVDVPGRVGVIGFDNWDVMVEASRPPLSTIDMSLHEVGSTAAEALLAAIDTGRLEPGIRRIDCQLIPRESTAVE